MSNARQRLEDIADLLYSQAVDAHAEGMSLIERSTRIRQLATICSDDEARRLVDALEEDHLSDIGNTNSRGGSA